MLNYSPSDVYDSRLRVRVLHFGQKISPLGGIRPAPIPCSQQGQGDWFVESVIGFTVLPFLSIVLYRVFPRCRVMELTLFLAASRTRIRE